MPKNVMKLMKPSPNLGRNAFDLSHRVVTDVNFGELRPILNIETVPNDSFTIKASDLLRCMPLVTSPFMRAKQHLDLWFVPYSALWSRFNEFMVDKDEPSSSALESRTFIPHAAMLQLNNLVGDGSLFDICGMAYNHTSAKLLADLGYGAAYYHNGQTISDSTNKKVNLWRLAAYNYIWYKEYRQQYYDDGSWNCANFSAYPAAAARLFNFDHLPCSSESLSLVGEADLMPMVQMRYRTWKKDLYTGLLPSSQYGAVSSVGLSNMSLQAFNTSNYSLPNAYLTTGSNGIVTTSSEVSNSNPTVPSTLNSQSVRFVSSSAFDVLALRKSEAIQKWRENALRAGNQIEDNFEAHYGSKPHSHMITHPTFIGSVDAPLNISDVMTTANDSYAGDMHNNQVGDIAGKGLSTFADRSFHFKTNDFGVIMGIYSILPETEYNAFGVDRNNCLLEREDYFIPEYENLGLEAVSSMNFACGPAARVLGYAPRYYGYKQKLDLVTSYNMVNGSVSLNQGTLRFWTSPNYVVTDNLANSGELTLRTLYVNPHVFDVNFGFVATKTQPQFILDFFADVTAVRSMSVTGLPSF